MLPFLSRSKAKAGQKTDQERRIGLNIGRSSIVGCEIHAEKNRFTIERFHYKSFHGDHSLGLELKDFFQEAKFQSKKANISLKGHGVVVRFLTFPKMSRADFTSALQFEAEKYLPFNISEVVMDFHIVNEFGASSDVANMQVILVAARRNEIERIANAARDAGIQLNAIDVDIFAITNLFAYAFPEAKEHTYGIIDFGAVDSSLGIISKGELVFSRDIAFGANDLTEFVKRKLNISQDAASKFLTPAGEENADNQEVINEGLNRLLQELKSSLNYYYNQHENASQIEKIFISGGFSQLPVLKPVLEKQMEVPVSAWDPLPSFQLGKGINPESIKKFVPYLPVALGLGIRPK